MTGDLSRTRPRKRLGQHFLRDRNIIDKILTAIDPQADDRFVEIGPGDGALTRPLLERVAQLDVVEIDRDLAARLRAEIDDPRLTIHEADALKFRLSGIDTDVPLRLAGNLPYNISTPLLFHLLGQSERLADLHVMLQKEVVARMCAAPGNRTYGRLTVALAARCRVEALFDIRPGSFSPPPKVDSAVVRLIPDAQRRARIVDEIAFDQLINRAFSQRRKRLSNALKGLLDSAALESAGVDPGLRPEQISVEQFVELANRLAAAREPLG